MKKLTNYFFIALAAVVMFTSCEDEETDKSPSLNFKGGAEYVSSDVTLTVGEAFTIGLTGAPNASTNDKLVGLTVTATFDNVPETLIDEELDKLTSLDMDIELTAPEAVGTARIVIELTDNGGETAQLILNITTEEGALPLTAFTAVLMGAQSNATEGSYLDADEGEVYLKAAADASSDIIDIIYYYGGDNKATLTAPDDVTVNGGTGNLSLAVDFATKNATRFNTNPGITAEAFDAMTDNSVIADVNVDASKANLLSVGDVVVFETVAGKKGAFKVASIDGEREGSITIDVKIQ